MEYVDPAQLLTPKSHINNEKNDFIEELNVIKGNENYKIQFRIKGNKNELTIKVISENFKNIYYFERNYTLNELQYLFKIFAVFGTVKDIILFLKDFKYEIDEKDEILILKFNAFLPDGKSKLMELELKKKLMDVNQIVKNLFEEIKTIKINMQKEKQDSLNRELNYKKEISDLKKDSLNYKKEILDLKKDSLNYKKEISDLKHDSINKEINYKKEISNLKQDSLNRELNYKKEISILKEENKIMV